jgi:hypothetical protein
MQNLKTGPGKRVWVFLGASCWLEQPAWPE